MSVKTATAVFVVGLVSIAWATSIQSGGGGSVTGAAIAPASVTASGSAPQFVCSATSGCELDVATSAATMTSTVPGLDVVCTATPAADDRLQCFGYGTSGSPTRVLCVDKEGDVTVVNGGSIGSAGTPRITFGASSMTVVGDFSSSGEISTTNSIAVTSTIYSPNDYLLINDDLRSYSAVRSFKAESATNDATTSSAVAAFVLKLLENIADTDLALALVNSADQNVLTVDETGAVGSKSSKMVGTITLAGAPTCSGTATVATGARCVCGNESEVEPVQCSVSGTTLTANGIASCVADTVISYICVVDL